MRERDDLRHGGVFGCSFRPPFSQSYAEIHRTDDIVIERLEANNWSQYHARKAIQEGDAAKLVQIMAMQPRQAKHAV